MCNVINAKGFWVHILDLLEKYPTLFFILFFFFAKIKDFCVAKSLHYHVLFFLNASAVFLEALHHFTSYFSCPYFLLCNFIDLPSRL